MRRMGARTYGAVGFTCGLPPALKERSIWGPVNGWETWEKSEKIKSKNKKMTELKVVIPY